MTEDNIEAAIVAVSEVASDMRYLMGRASNEGHESGQRLASLVKGKLDAAITALSARASAGEGGVMRRALDLIRQGLYADADGVLEAALTAAPQPAQAGASGGGGSVDDETVKRAMDAVLPNGHRVWAYVAGGNPDRGVTGREVMRAALEAAQGPRGARRPCPRCDTCNDLIVVGYCRDCAHTMADAAEASQPAAAQGGIAGLPAKWREDASGAEGCNYTTYEEGRIAEKRRCAAELEAALAAAPQPQDGQITEAPGFPDAVVVVSNGIGEPLSIITPAHGDGEGDAFEAWAASQKYDMTKHPLHWLFLNERTYAARQGWKAGMEYALTTRPTPEAQEARDAADARRYRWLRDRTPGGSILLDADPMRWLNCDEPPSEWDAAIDAALALPAQGEG